MKTILVVFVSIIVLFTIAMGVYTYKNNISTDITVSTARK